MIKRRSTFLLGVFIVLVSSSFLGLPSAWKNFFLFISGLILIGLSVKFKLALPKKPVKKTVKKDREKEKKQTGHISDIVVKPLAEGSAVGSGIKEETESQTT